MGRTQPSTFDRRRFVADINLGQVTQTDTGSWRLVISGKARAKSRVAGALVDWVSAQGFAVVDHTGRWRLTAAGLTWLEEQ